MKKKIVVQKEKFDSVLSQLLKAPPIPMKQIKTTEHFVAYALHLLASNIVFLAEADKALK